MLGLRGNDWYFLDCAFINQILVHNWMLFYNHLLKVFLSKEKLMLCRIITKTKQSSTMGFNTNGSIELHSASNVLENSE